MLFDSICDISISPTVGNLRPSYLLCSLLCYRFPFSDSRTLLTYLRQISWFLTLAGLVLLGGAFWRRPQRTPILFVYKLIKAQARGVKPHGLSLFANMRHGGRFLPRSYGSLRAFLFSNFGVVYIYRPTFALCNEAEDVVYRQVIPASCLVVAYLGFGMVV